MADPEAAVRVDPDAQAFAKLPGDTIDAKITSSIRSNR
jgi:hypothetical protein